MAVLAHPDDESLGFGGTLARYAAEGIETYLVTATRGERGRFGSRGKHADPVEVGRIRELELRAAAAVLGIGEVSILGYGDGEVDQLDSTIAIRAIVEHIRRVRPHLVITFGPDGAYGHPDHIAISQFTTAAVVCAGDAGYGSGFLPAHRVAKLQFGVAKCQMGRNVDPIADGEALNPRQDKERKPGEHNQIERPLQNAWPIGHRHAKKGLNAVDGAALDNGKPVNYG